MEEAVCVDASFVLACLLPERLSERALSLWEGWRQDGRRLVAPSLLAYEVSSGLRRAVFDRRLTPEEGELALNAFRRYGLTFLEHDRLLGEAWEVGRRLGLARLYDAFYVAVGAVLGCEVWTVDERLHRRASPLFPFVRWVGHAR